MATIRKMEEKILDKKASKHTEVEATYSIVKYGEEKFLQIVTCGTNNRKVLGQTSQTMRFSKEAIDTLDTIIKKYKLS